MIIFTRVLLYDHKQEDLIGKGEESWTECGVDLESISAIRKCHDEGREDCVVVHFRNGDDYFILDAKYDDVAPLWVGDKNAKDL